MSKKATLVVRLLLGLMMVVFGLNKFLEFMAMPESTPEMGAFMVALIDSGFVMPIVAVVEIIAGILFLTNKFTALAAVVLFPIMVNAFLAHLFLDPAGLGGAAMAIVMNVFLFFAYKEKYTELLKA
jgi:putative oxidoreductase